MAKKNDFRPWAMLLLLLGTAFCLACIIPADRISPDADAAGFSAAGRIMGGARAALSEQLFETADLYFHKGVPHAHKEALKDTLFERMAGVVCPHEHVHADGAEIAEMMPWLRLATRLNPRDVESYIVAAFWLAGPAGRPGVALEVLSEAQQNNPKDYRVYLERGRILLRQNRLVESKRAFETGMAFWPGPEDPGSEEARYGLRNLLLHRAMLYEVDGETNKAASDLRRIEELYPGSTPIAKRADALERDETPATPARKVLAALLSSNARERSACHREHNHDGGQHHAGETHELEHEK